MVHGDVPAGGSEALSELIDQFGEEIEADLQRYYCLDLLDVFRVESCLTPRKVLRLLGQLDDRAATVAAMAGGPEWRGWGPDRAILADVWDLLARANTPPKKKSPKYPRPERKRRVMRVKDLPGAVSVG